MSDPEQPALQSDPYLPAGARVRPLEEQDAPAVARIAGQLGQSEEPEYWRRKLSASNSDLACGQGIEVAGELVAHMLGRVKGGEFGLDEGTAWLELLGVDPRWQGQGLARSLAEALLEQFGAYGAQRVLTMVMSREDRLHPFFRSLGFRQSRLICLERRL